MKIPYGVAAFSSLRSEGQLYVDRTDRIAVIEELGKSLALLATAPFREVPVAGKLTHYPI